MFERIRDWFADLPELVQIPVMLIFLFGFVGPIMLAVLVACWLGLYQLALFVVGLF